MARCGCGGACSCALVSGTGITVTGSGTPANPWKPNATIASCTDVRGCITANQGAAFNQTTGVISVCVSPNANNGLTRDANGCLFVAAGASTVTTGCGLTGTGAPASPVRANTQTWPYTCDPLTQGGVVSCDPSGVLVGEPRSRSQAFSTSLDTPYNNAVPTTLTQSNLIQTISLSATNPDPCRAATVIQLQEMGFALTLPPGGRAEYGFLNNNMVNHTNRGTTNETDFYVQVAKAVPLGTIAPGATQTFSFGMYLGQGTAGATYTQGRAILRVLMITA